MERQQNEPRTGKNQRRTTRKVFMLAVLVVVAAGMLLDTISQIAFVQVAAAAQPTGLSREVQIANQRFALTIAAASGATIPFKTNNGESKDGQAASESRIPHLVLLRNGELTGASERSLTISLDSLTGSEMAEVVLDIRIETQKGNPDRNSTNSSRIVVHQLSMDAVGGASQEITFGPVSAFDGTLNEPTPTGYYRLVVTAAILGEATDRQEEVALDYAFLLENQWVAQLQTPEQAGPQELLVFYTDMTPFQINSFDRGGRLPRREVNRYIEENIIPGMVSIFELQKSWGFVWYPEWRGFRPEGRPDQLTVALTDREEWYHGPAPTGGYGLIAINVNQYKLQTYSSLTDWILSMFSHELFHNQQRNLNLHAGGQGDTEGRYASWEVVSEGTALLVESLTREVLGFADGNKGNPYTVRAAAFINRLETSAGEINLPFGQMSPYEMVVYWRFLFDSTRQNVSSDNDVAAGLVLIRTTLETLYRDQDLLAIQPQDLPAGFDRLMEQVLVGGYAENLKVFGQIVSSRQ
jgi:hypothetical protein